MRIKKSSLVLFCLFAILLSSFSLGATNRIGANYTYIPIIMDSRVNDNYTYIRIVMAALANTAPNHTAPILNASLGFNTTWENLTCFNQTTTDPEGNPVTNEYRWYVNGVLNTSFNDLNNVSFGNTSIGESWICQVRPFDGDLFGPALNSSALVIVTQPNRTAQHIDIDISDVTLMATGEVTVFNGTVNITSVRTLLQYTSGGALKVTAGGNSVFRARMLINGVQLFNQTIVSLSSVSHRRVWTFPMTNITTVIGLNNITIFCCSSEVCPVVK